MAPIGNLRDQCFTQKRKSNHLKIGKADVFKPMVPSTFLLWVTNLRITYDKITSLDCQLQAEQGIQCLRFPVISGTLGGLNNWYTINMNHQQTADWLCHLKLHTETKNICFPTAQCGGGSFNNRKPVKDRLL